VLAAAVLYRAASDAEWLEAAMEPVGDARWTARFQVQSNEQHWYTVAAWIDRFASWRRDMRKRIDANQDVATELVEGAAIVREAAARAPEHDQLLMERALARAEQADNQTTAADILLHADLAQLVARWQPRHLFSRYAPALPLWVDRPRARFASWYEFFPRSEGASGARSGTLLRSRAAAARHRRDGLRRGVPAPHPPHRPHRAQGAEQQPLRRPGRPGQPVGHRQ
jgi:starch synthase (maltosyl-transferring)